MVNVYWIAKYPQIGNTSPHSHRFYQLLVPTGGEGTILIGETPYPALRGTALLADRIFLTGCSVKKPPRRPNSLTSSFPF